MPHLGTLASFVPKVAAFVLAMLVGGGVAYVGASAISRPDIAPTAGEAPDYLLGSGSAAEPGAPAAFDLIDAQQQPQTLDGLPPADLALAAASLLESDPVVGLRPLGFPRVPPVSQFDGGPFAGANCTLAAGAMLARLGFGIVTTGSILRTLQDDQVGGTGLDDLATALYRGYGVTFRSGSVTPDQLKSLLAAGYGAVVQGSYDRIPGPLRLQSSFTGPHAIYLDGYFPGDGSTPPAYYVIDPLGRGGTYRGDWWPASIVDQFGVAFGYGGRIAAAWVFPPGGIPPEVVGPDVLPIPPSGGDTPGPAPSESPAPGETAAPGGEPGDDEPTVTAEPPGPVDVTIGGHDLDTVFDVCLVTPRPVGCPRGIPGIFKRPLPVFTFPFGPDIEVKFVDSDRPNMVLVGFTVDPAAPVNVRYWEADGAPATVFDASSMSSVTLLGEPMVVGRLDTLAATTYHFQIVAGSGLFSSFSPIGSFTTADGVTKFEVAVSAAADPVFKLGTGLSPYTRLAVDGLALPLVRTTGGSVPRGCSDRVYDFGGADYCLAVDASIDTTCYRASVDYELSGIDASGGVLIRAFPGTAGVVDGAPTLAGVLEAEGPPFGGSVSVGCLGSGLTYTIGLDAVGDDRGILMTRIVAVP